VITTMRRKGQCLIALAAVAALAATAIPGNAKADVPLGYVTFDARAVGGVVTFSTLVPDAVPLEIAGGSLASTASARLGPQAFASAGILPIAALGSIGIIIPQQVPGVAVPIPEQFRTALGGIDYTKLPQFCQALFPAAAGTSSHGQCGGPAQQDPSLGFTADVLDGKVFASGRSDDDQSGTAHSESHGGTVTIPGVQGVARNFSSSAAAGINSNGVPEADADAQISSASLLGGALKIEGLTSHTKLAYDGTAEGLAGASSFRISGATLLGTPIAIGRDGFQLADAPLATESDVADLTAQVEKAINVSGLKIRLLPASPLKRAGSQVSMSSGGIEVSYTQPAPGEVRYTSIYGQSQASLTAVPGGTPSDSASTDNASSGVSDTAAPVDGVASAGMGMGMGMGMGTGMDLAGAGAVPPTLTQLSSGGLAGEMTQQAGNPQLFAPIGMSAITLPSKDLEHLYFAFVLLTGFAVILRRWRRVSSLA
jgi:hypothetical protein